MRHFDFINMSSKVNTCIWTIGHSTRSIDIFLKMLSAFRIEMLADVRRFPGSRKYPQYNSDALKASLTEAGIQYMHLADLGGRRKPVTDAAHSVWRSAGFRGYADYMKTPSYNEAILQLTNLAQTQRTAFMCSEAVWWRCHRALISDDLKSKGWEVMHIMNDTTATPHPYTSAFRDSRKIEGQTTLFPAPDANTDLN